MKDLSIYFQPVEKQEAIENTLGSVLYSYSESNFPELNSKGIAFFYVPEYRNGNETYQSSFNDSYRNHLYSMQKGQNWNFSLYDLGNLLPGSRIEDTYFALSQVCAELIMNSIIPVVLGGSQDLSYAVYKAYEELEQLVNILIVDNKCDLGSPDSELSASAYINKMLMHRPCHLFNLAVLGCQSPYLSIYDSEIMDKLFFDVIRLGEFKSDFKIAEPHIRNTDFISIDLQSLKASEFSGTEYSEPNGFDNAELCQIAKYAGMADKLSSFGIFNWYPAQVSTSNHKQLAQLLWYFAEGYSQRCGDFPVGTKKNYTKFTVYLDDIDHELVFYKSDKSDRWWMEVPYPPKEGVNFERHHLVPCDKSHYSNALKNNIPNLWWKTYQKLG